MSEDAPDLTTPSERSTLPAGTRIATVASLYNPRYVDAMLGNAQDELHRLLPEGDLPIYRVPGAFEIPVLCKKIAVTDQPQAILALGVIIRGSTMHADLIGEALTGQLLEISVQHQIPLIHEVLLHDDETQAQERCMGERLNRGLEAARTAVNMAELFYKIDTRQG